jgi:hypothetical protein
VRRPVGECSNADLVLKSVCSGSHTDRIPETPGNPAGFCDSLFRDGFVRRRPGRTGTPGSDPRERPIVDLVEMPQLSGSRPNTAGRAGVAAR